MNIIETLNKHAAKTPDEIVRQLNIRGWVNIASMTREQHAHFFMKPCVLMCTSTSHSVFSRIQHRDWNFWFEWNDLSYWRHGYVKLFEEYTDGDFPDRPVEQAGRQDS